MGRNRVIGQTGKVVLSDDSTQRKIANKRTARYVVIQRSNRRFELSVSSPPYSRIYGVTVYELTPARAKAKLKAVLANDYQYFGNLIREADKKPKVTMADAERAGGYRELANNVVHGAII